MRSRKRYCSVYWKEDNGVFLPEDWGGIAFSRQVEQTFTIIRKNILRLEIPIFVRGSLIEEHTPHPKSDIDILYIASQLCPPVFHPDIQAELKRPVDINPYHYDALEPREYLLPLIHIRSYQISGPVFERQEVEITNQFIEDLWLQYRVQFLPSSIQITGIKRVMLLKHLFRSLGLISLALGEGFTRDIPACIEWLIRKYPRLGEYSQKIWALRSSTEPIYIEPIRDWIVSQKESSA